MKKEKLTKVMHLAGVVPIAAPPLDFGMPWNDSLIPVGQEYLAAERAVYECALAGCDSIWVVCHVGIEPLVRKRLGDFIADPVSLTTGLNPSLKRRDISIYYIPIRPKDRDIRDCLSWSILYGADTAFRISATLSTWILPTKYYCAFPYGIMPDKIVWKNRARIGSNEKTLFSYDGKTVKDGLHMSFTFDENDYKKARDVIIKKQIEKWDLKTKTVARNYKIEEVFQHLVINQKDIISTPWFYDISNWHNYKKYLGSSESSEIVKNKGSFLKDKRPTFMNYQDSLKMTRINRNLIVEKPEAPEELEEL